MKCVAISIFAGLNNHVFVGLNKECWESNNSVGIEHLLQSSKKSCIK